MADELIDWLAAGIKAKYEADALRARSRYTIETEREEDGRWIAEIPELPGVMAYGATEADAISRVEKLAKEVTPEKGGAHPPDGGGAS